MWKPFYPEPDRTYGLNWIYWNLKKLYILIWHARSRLNHFMGIFTNKLLLIYVPMWSRHPKVALNVLLRISSLLMTHEHVAFAIYRPKTSDNCRIIIPCSITMKLYKLDNESIKWHSLRYLYHLKARKRERSREKQTFSVILKTWSRKVGLFGCRAICTRCMGVRFV